MSPDRHGWARLMPGGSIRSAPPALSALRGHHGRGRCSDQPGEGKRLQPSSRVRLQRRHFANKPCGLVVGELLMDFRDAGVGRILRILLAPAATPFKKLMFGLLLDHRSLSGADLFGAAVNDQNKTSKIDVSRERL
jgi:hypothetical protein